MGDFLKFDKLIILTVLVLIILSSCRKDEIFIGDMPEISASSDTLTFDTVFTQVGSATRFIKIYNNENQDITVDVEIENVNSSFFRLNVDGEAGKSVKDVRIGANDSIYVFADVTIDPDQPLSVSPFIIEEKLLIKSGDSQKEVLLEAWGQNANYIPGERKNGLQSILSCDLGQVVWDDPKPYVIYGILLIDECELVLPAGTDVYVHGGVVVGDDFIYSDGFLFFSNTAKLTANGTVDNPVTFQGDRLEQSFDIGAGQWVGIRFLAESRGHVLEHVKIKNATVGLVLDSLSEATIDGCEIMYTTASGIIAFHADLTATNTLIHDNGQNAVSLVQGGNYSFNHCTMTSYGNQFPALLMNNYRIEEIEDADDILLLNPLNAIFKNTIITGNDGDEIGLEDATRPLNSTEGEPGFFNYSFEHCLVTIDEISDEDQFPDFLEFCNNCIETSFGDVLFIDTDGPDFHLDTLSIAEMKALPSELAVDLEGFDRDATMPDIGCYEYQN